MPCDGRTFVNYPQMHHTGVGQIHVARVGHLLELNDQAHKIFVDKVESGGCQTLHNIQNCLDTVLTFCYRCYSQDV